MTRTALAGSGGAALDPFLGLWSGTWVETVTQSTSLAVLRRPLECVCACQVLAKGDKFKLLASSLGTTASTRPTAHGVQRACLVACNPRPTLQDPPPLTQHDVAGEQDASGGWRLAEGLSHSVRPRSCAARAWGLVGNKQAAVRLQLCGRTSVRQDLTGTAAHPRQ